MSDWSPQDFPRSAPSTPGGGLIARVDTLSEKLREATSNLLRTAGIFITQQGMRIASSLLVEGDLASTGSADITGTTHIGGSTDIDGTLNVDADATFGGSVAITGTLSLPAGIIDNDALANPQTQVSNYGNSTAFAVASTPGSVLAAFTVVVPAGFTKASFIAEAAAGVHNISGASNYAYLRVFASGPSSYLTWGSRQNVQIDAGHTRTLAALLVRAVDVPLVGGDVLTIYCEVYVDTAMASSVANFASVAALVTFTR